MDMNMIKNSKHEFRICFEFRYSNFGSTLIKGGTKCLEEIEPAR
jgi:hypothetical protein